MTQFSEVLSAYRAVEAIRPDIAGIMGAFGAALIAKDRYTGQKSTMLSFDEINRTSFQNINDKMSGMYKSLSAHCKRIYG